MSEQIETDPRATWPIVLAPAGASAEMISALEANQVNTRRWPQASFHPPGSYDSLDSALDNLFGYDWIVFVSEFAVEAFFSRLKQDTSEIDSLRVCAIGEVTLSALEGRHVHVDVVPQQFESHSVVREIATFVNYNEYLRGLNFLIPQADIGRDYLKEAFEHAHARADVVISYRTVRASDCWALEALKLIVSNGGVDCALFTSAEDFDDFAKLFDTKDLSPLLKNIPVVCADEQTSVRGEKFAISPKMISSQNSPAAVADAVARVLRSQI